MSCRWRSDVLECVGGGNAAAGIGAQAVQYPPEIGHKDRNRMYPFWIQSSGSYKTLTRCKRMQLTSTLAMRVTITETTDRLPSQDTEDAPDAVMLSCVFDWGVPSCRHVPTYKS